MKTFCIVIFIAVCSVAVSVREAYAWSELKTAHFIVYYKNTPLDMAGGIARDAESSYTTISENIGMRRFNFWLWENRAALYIHDNTKDYQLSTNRPAWSGGFTLARSKTIHIFPDAQGLYKGTLSHEIGHIIFREAVGFTNQAVPIWLEEGVASLQEFPDFALLKAIMKAEVAKGNLLPLEKLSQIDPNVLSKQESDQPLYQEAIRLFYLESISVAAYLIEAFGKDNFSIFCRALKNKGKLDEALSMAYPFKNVRELSRAWEEYLLAL